LDGRRMAANNKAFDSGLEHALLPFAKVSFP